MQEWKEWIKDKNVVFFVAETVPSVAGSGINAFRYAKYLRNFSKSVKIICFNYNNKLKKSEEIENVLIQRIPYYNYNLLSKLLSIPILVYFYRKEIFSCNICFIYGAYMPGYEIILLISFFWPRKIIFQSTLFGDDDIESILNRKPRFLRPVKKILIKHISVYYAINESFAEKWISTIKSKTPIVLRSQGVDADWLIQSNVESILLFKNKLKIPKNTLVILSVGILINRKGYLEVFTQLRKLNIPFIYLIAGLDSPDPYHRSSSKEAEEMSQIKNTGKEMLGEKVRFLGHIKNLQQLYSIADIFLHAATQEGTPGAVLEAMLYRLPVIVREIEGAGFIFKNELNCLVFKEPDEINSCIKKIHGDIQLSKILVYNANDRIIKNETFEKVSEEILKYCI